MASDGLQQYATGSAKLAVHVLERKDGKWVVKTAGKRAHCVVETMNEAVVIGRRMAANAATELVVHRPDGSIRSIDTYGNVPFPPVGFSAYRGLNEDHTD